MKVFVINRLDEAAKDEAQAMTVVAEDERMARTLASSSAWDEKHEVWIEKSNSTCLPIADKAIGDRRVVMMDINRG